MRTLVKFTAVAGLAATLTLSACSSATDDETDGSISLRNCGRTVTLTTPAERAVTVNQGATESALAIGAGPRLIGTAYLDDEIAPQFASDYAKIPVLSGAAYPSREVVLEKRPDLVTASYATAFADKAIGTEASLARLGVAAYVSPFACADTSTRPAPSWDAVAAETSDYGTLFGRKADADRVNAAMRSTLTGLRQRAAGRDQMIFWWDSGTDKPYAGVSDGGPQLIIDAVGAKNVFADLTGNWATVGWEPVLAADPDVIVLVDASWDTAAAKRTHLESDPALKDLTAVRNRAYVVIPFSESTPGVRLIDGAQKLSDALAK